MATIECRTSPDFDPVTYCLIPSIFHFISDLIVTLQKTRNISQSFQDDAWFKKLFLTEISESKGDMTCYLHIEEVWRIFFYSKREYFTMLNQRLMPKRAAKFAKRAKALSFSGWPYHIISWNIGISFKTPRKNIFKCVVVWNKSLSKIELRWNKKLIYD